MCAIAQHFGRPGTPTDQAWIESLNGTIKMENPHLLAIRDPATLRAELAVVREHYNTGRLHAGIGYVTPDDEHDGRVASDFAIGIGVSFTQHLMGSPTSDGGSDHVGIG